MPNPIELACSRSWVAPSQRTIPVAREGEGRNARVFDIPRRFALTGRQQRPPTARLTAALE